mmetsp:Transcript_57693/g.134412  ORF Transcript_57693/g.134412 Transcript_57693/m.134412 type:complete len:762 (+) Transcript_57693:85-2370(+)
MYGQDDAVGGAENLRLHADSLDVDDCDHVMSTRRRASPDPDGYWDGPTVEPPQCSPIEFSVEPEASECDQDLIERLGCNDGEMDDGSAMDVSPEQKTVKPPPLPVTQNAAEAQGTPATQIQCTAGGKRPQPSDFSHCPTPQSFVRCGPHHRAELRVMSKEDIEALHDIWWRYRDDLTWPWYEKKPQFSERDFDTFREKAQKVVDAMVEEYHQPMVLDQATISNTNHVGHPPHADNVQFDSVWWNGKRIRAEDEVVAAQEGAYVLWRPEKTSYRSYSCTVSLSDPNGYEGGEVQFFARWGDKDPVATYKCAEGCGVAFCGCQRNIHAVTGVKHGFRLVFLVWTRPPNVCVPESQRHVCYFRPGTGLGVWLTTADILRHGRKRNRNGMQSWVPKEEDDNCMCLKCVAERQKLSWKACCAALKTGTTLKPLPLAADHTPTTSAGTSPRNNETRNDAPSSDSQGSTMSESEDLPEPPRELLQDSTKQHCPHPQGVVRCAVHERKQLQSVLSKADIRELKWIWQTHQDNLSCPWYEKKPTFSEHEFVTFRRISQKVVDAMIEHYGEPLVLDQATVSNTNHIGHPPHADNVQFDSVWWGGRQIKQKDELAATRGGAEVLWRDSKTSYRNYSATVALTDPSQYGGGELEFYSQWGQREPNEKHRLRPGCGVAFCGCQKNIHAVTGVKWGFRLVLLIWTRPPDATVPEDQKHVCYFRPGTGLSVWLTSADLQDYPKRRQKRQTWVPIVNTRDDAEADGEENGEHGKPSK